MVVLLEDTSKQASKSVFFFNKDGVKLIEVLLFGPPEFNALSSNMWSLPSAPLLAPICMLVSLFVAFQLELKEGTGVANAKGVEIVCAYY